jgi:membrane protease subunit HflC
MNRSLMFVLIGAGAALLVGMMAVFTVSENELAIKFRMGEFEQAEYQPGIHVMWPLINNVRKYEKRIVTLDMPPARYLTQEKKNVIVDAFVKWRIADATAFYKAASGDVAQANLRLEQVVNDGLRNEFGKRTIQEAISGQRAEIMNVITEQFAEQARQFGIQVVDVRISRIELPNDVSDSVYKRMEAERSKVAMDLRSKGGESSERIKADADRQRTIILAEAFRDAERIRGDGDARAAAIYGRAFSRNQEFFKLYRSLDAYKNVFKNQQDVLVLDPNSEFFRYFKNPNGR